MIQVLVNHTQLNYSNEPLLNIGRNNGTCRFCKSENVTFKKKAHSIPELLGNKSLFTLDECDSCNEKFSDFERNLSEFIPPSFATRIKGKKAFQKIIYKAVE